MKNVRKYQFQRKLSKSTRQMLSDHRWFMLEWCDPKYDLQCLQGIKWSDFYKGDVNLPLS